VQCPEELKRLEPRLAFSPKLPTSVLLSIMGQLKRAWREVLDQGACLSWAMETVLGRY